MPEKTGNPVLMYIAELGANFGDQQLADLYYEVGLRFCIPLEVPEDDQTARALIQKLQENALREGLGLPSCPPEIKNFLSGGPRPPITS